MLFRNILYHNKIFFSSYSISLKNILGDFSYSNIVRFKHDLKKRQNELMAKSLPKRRKLPSVKNVIAVASGKGGVGKSTTSVNLAVALSNLEKGRNDVGLLDLDVFGPSIPKMMNLRDKPQIDKGENFIPLKNHGIKCMSMGFLMDENEAVVWRGPMVMSAVQRLLLRTAWEDLDYLILDLPPGTGDTQLSISQLIQVDGAVIVSTPQDIALLDARRGAEMFRKVNIPVLGLVQNMSVFICPKCGHREHVFGHDGAAKLATEIDVDVLGDVSLDPLIRAGADDGIPVTIQDPNNEQSKVYAKIALAVKERLEEIKKVSSEA